MSKLEQVLTIEPATELKFIGPFSSVVTSELKLANPSPKRVAFKVKTTAPKRYCVRPNSGLIEPNGNAVVSVMLQPFEYDPAEKNNHKFMVQSMSAPGATAETLDQLWKDATPAQLMDSKLKCVFELPTQETTVQNNLDKSVSNTDDNTKVTPAKTVPVASTSAEKTPAKVTNVVDEEVKRVQAECQQLSAEIQRLREDNNKLREEGVRLRRVAGTAPSSFPSSSAPSSSMSQSSGLAQVNAEANVQPPILYLIAMLILGVIIGKLLL